MANTAVLDPDDKRYLKSVSARSDRKGLARAGGHLGAIALASALIWLASGTWLVWPAMFVQGICLVFLFCALHETVHRTAFYSLWLNAVVSYVSGFIVLLAPTWFRAFHLAHHRHTQIPGEDPELDDKRIDTWPRYLWHVSGVKYWIAAVRGLLSQASGRGAGRFVAPPLKPRVVAEARWFLAGYAVLAAASIMLGTDAVLRYWIVPMLLAQPVLRLYLLAEHGLCPFIGDPFSNTRTTMTTRVVRFLAWNMPHHTEHHAFMAVPFHALPKVHERFKDRLENVSDGYAAFNMRYLRDGIGNGPGDARGA